MYNTFRKNGEPTYYKEEHTAWQADILECGFIFAGCILAVAFFSILPGINGKSRLFTFIWIVLGISVGTSIVVTNYSPDWEVATTSTLTKYKAGTGEDIKANVGLHIGLRGINITLKGEPIHQLNETINYNEDFGWTWRQGRNFFGPFASNFNQEYRAAQLRGLPLPILWVAEYFTLDGDGIRWGRLYRESGLYAHTCLWVALASWVLANILLFVLIRYGAYLIILTGLSMCTSNAIKHLVRNELQLAIPFTAEHVLNIHYGPAFWLCLVTGSLCITCGLLVLIVDLRAPRASAAFFGMDILQEEKQIQAEITRSKDNSDLTEIVEVGSTGEVVRNIAVRPAGVMKADNQAPQYDAMMVARDLDNVFGDSNIDCYDEYADTDTSLSETDEECTDTKANQSFFKDYLGVFVKPEQNTVQTVPVPSTYEQNKTVPNSVPLQTTYEQNGTGTEPETRTSGTRRKGFIQRFQVKRRIPSASPYNDRTRFSDFKKRFTDQRNKKTRVQPLGTQRWH